MKKKFSKRFKKLLEISSDKNSSKIEDAISKVKKNCTTKFNESIDISDSNKWDFPEGTKFFKTFSYAREGGAEQRPRPIETRLIWKRSNVLSRGALSQPMQLRS